MNSINNTWVFGNNAGLNFNTFPPTPLSPSAMNTAEGCASISDGNGNLLFYTDGTNVWDSTNTVVATGLLGNSSSTQSAIIVPKPGSSTEYYVFTADGASGGSNHFNGILLNTAGWLSSPLTGLPSTAGFSPTEKVTAMHHANCKDFWIITIIQVKRASVQEPFASGIGFFRIFLLTASGLTHAGDTPINQVVDDLGYLKGSPDNSRIAVANFLQQNVLYFPFNNATGVVAIPNGQKVVIPVDTANPSHVRAPYGVEFSPDSKLLYIAVLGNRTGQNQPAARGYLYQVDTAVFGQPVLVGTHQDIDDPTRDGYSLGALQLGIDGLIYMAKDSEKSLGAILSPNVIGTGCNPNFNYVALVTGTYSNLGLPNLLPNACLDTCGQIREQVDELLTDACGQKKNTLSHCDPEDECDCDEGCSSVPFPKIKPCISIKWGDSDCDCIETDDYEVLCITVCNCYTNVTFANFSIGMLEVVDANGQPVPLLPDGSPSVQLTPIGPFCFGDIGPCYPNQTNCVAREFALLTRGAVGGGYKILVKGICFDICFHYDDQDCFLFELCKD